VTSQIPQDQYQVAPYPTALASLVDDLVYKPGWSFRLRHIARGQGSEGLTLIIMAFVPDTYHPETQIVVNHYMIVPAASYDRRAWQRWLLDQVLLVESHEACEYFCIDGKRPFPPNHGPGRDPYQILEIGTVTDAETSFRGVRNEGSQQWNSLHCPGQP
jgi:hypothetical protein